ncbi:hypothetical protein LCGC14_2205350 [marine sediment metagenome]|uniref:Uncharacterized protein n=1 Tax=marine sediment metagenome TaxID=412755 RepID=A0A0F9DFP8_9ZZZZ
MASLKAEIKWSPGTPNAYDFWVDDRREIVAESLAVVSNVRDSLLFFARGIVTEADEVADRIRVENCS